MAFELQAEPRQVFGKHVKALRRAGYVPAEVYGRTIKNQSIQVPVKTLKRVLAEAGNTNLISIKIGKKKPIQTLARNIQYSPVKQELLHVDFYAVVMTEKVTVSVPIHTVGESEAVKRGGALMHGLNELELEALPADIPEVIEVDISGLEDFSDAIHVSDLKLPDSVNVLSSPDSLVVSVQPPRTLAAAMGVPTEEEREAEAEAEAEIGAEEPAAE